MIRCALCGFEYEPLPACPLSCPLRGGCHFVCCPHCGYQNIDASQAESVKFARALWSKYVDRKKSAQTKQAE